MRFAKTFVALATSVSLLATPVLASAKNAAAAAPAASSLKDLRAGSKVRKSEKAVGTPVLILAAIAAGLGVAAAAGAFDNKSSSP